MDRAEAVLALLTPTSSLGEALAFAHELDDIGRALTLDPGLAPRVRAFVERTAPQIGYGLGLVPWIHFAHEEARSRSSETPYYTRALALRSSIAFFLELYGDSVAHDFVVGIDTDQLDRDLAEWGRVQWLEAVPEGYPPSHVWWHQSMSGR